MRKEERQDLKASIKEFTITLDEQLSHLDKEVKKKFLEAFESAFEHRYEQVHARRHHFKTAEIAAQLHAAKEALGHAKIEEKIEGQKLLGRVENLGAGLGGFFAMIEIVYDKEIDQTQYHTTSKYSHQVAHELDYAEGRRHHKPIKKRLNKIAKQSPQTPINEQLSKEFQKIFS